MHEGLVALLRERPVVALDLLRVVHGIDLTPAHARRCPVDVLVVCVDHALAAALGAPIRLGRPC